jgi:crossover junction endodeoxyribonuclease RuvC
VKIFGIDPGSERTGYGCVETDGRRHHLVACGAISAPAGDSFPERLARIHRELTRHLEACRPDCVAIENLFFASNVRSALKLGHARGVAMLAAVQAGCPIVEYTPAEVKRAVVGYGRADKNQVQQMIRLLLGLREVPSPHDAADALAVAICHLHSQPPAGLKAHLTVNPTKSTTVGPPADTTSGIDVASGVSRTTLAKRTTKAPTSWRQYRPPIA